MPVITLNEFYTDRYAPHPLSHSPVGDFVRVLAGIDRASTTDPLSSLSVQATQGSLLLNLNYFPYSDLILDPLYLVYMPFAGAETGVGWTITASDSTGTSAPVFTPAIGAPVLLPFVTNIAVSDTSATPTVSWTLPDLTGFSVDLIRLRIVDVSTELQLTNFALPASSTSFTVPDGILVSGKSYIYRVILFDQAVGLGTENRSNAFSGITTVPEPGTGMLLLAALIGLVGAPRRGSRANPARSGLGARCPTGG
jgi:hypothetical protein